MFDLIQQCQQIHRSIVHLINTTSKIVIKPKAFTLRLTKVNLYAIGINLMYIMLLFLLSLSPLMYNEPILPK
jgi:hypothetical protein